MSISNFPFDDEETIYKNEKVLVKKISSGQFIIFNNGELANLRWDQDEALQIACDLSFFIWADEYREIK